MGKSYLFILGVIGFFQLPAVSACAAGGSPALVNTPSNPQFDPNADCPKMNEAKSSCDKAFDEMQKKAKDKDAKIDQATQDLNAAGNSISQGAAAMCAASAQLAMRYKDIGDKLSSYAETLRKAGGDTKKACESAASAISALANCQQKATLLAAVKGHAEEAGKKVEKAAQAEKGAATAHGLASSSQANCNNTDNSGGAQAAGAGGGGITPGGCAQNSSCQKDQWDGWNPLTSHNDTSNLSWEGPAPGTAGSNNANAGIGGWETTVTPSPSVTGAAPPPSGGSGGFAGGGSGAPSAPSAPAAPTQALTNAAATTAGNVAAQQLSATAAPSSPATAPLATAPTDPTAIARSGTGELGYYAPDPSKAKAKSKAVDEEEASATAAKAGNTTVATADAAAPAMVSLSLSSRAPGSALSDETDAKLARAEKLKKLDATQGAGAKAAAASAASSGGFMGGASAGGSFASRLRSSFSSWLSGGKVTSDEGGGGTAVRGADQGVDLSRFLPNMSNGGRTAGVTDTGLRASGLHSAGTDFFQKIQHRYRSLDGSFLKENGK